MCLRRGEYEEYVDRVVDMRSEVGVLTRNILMQGDDTSQESEFGGTILVHASTNNRARISDVEFRKMGQASRLGRYAVHWHMSNSVKGNYVRNCAIHHTYNRAVTVHGVHNLLVQGNVAYHVMGMWLRFDVLLLRSLYLSLPPSVYVFVCADWLCVCAFVGHTYFMEDGVEQNNTIEYNLAIYTIPNFHQLQSDGTPAMYWITNPSNLVRHNVAAGTYWCNRFCAFV